jgi:hypothetical protein
MTFHHVHTCGCGTLVACTQEPDRCAYPESWACETCTRDQFDQFVTHLSLNTHTLTLQETSHEGIRHLPRQVSQGR